MINSVTISQSSVQLLRNVGLRRYERILIYIKQLVPTSTSLAFTVTNRLNVLALWNMKRTIVKVPILVISVACQFTKRKRRKTRTIASTPSPAICKICLHPKTLS